MVGARRSLQGACRRHRHRHNRAGRRRTARTLHIRVKIKHRGTGWFDLAGWRLATRSRPAGGILLTEDGQPAGTAPCCLPADQRAVLHTFLARHGTRYPDLVRAPAGAQVRVEFLERSPTGILREGIARELRAAVDGLGRRPRARSPRGR
jgi:hypothetical protein